MTNKGAQFEIMQAPPTPPHTLLHEQVKGLLAKCTVLKVDLLQDRQICCFQACMGALLSPDILQAGAVKGLKIIIVISNLLCAISPV